MQIPRIDCAFLRCAPQQPEIWPGFLFLTAFSAKSASYRRFPAARTDLTLVASTRTPDLLKGELYEGSVFGWSSYIGPRGSRFCRTFPALPPSRSKRRR